MLKKMKRLLRIWWHFSKLSLAQCMAPILKLLLKSYRNLWIIAERGDDARDNAWFFFQYVRKNHPEVNIRYVISKDSADYPKVKELGNPIEHNSFLHYLCYAACKVRISSSMWGGDLPAADYFRKTKRHMNKRRKVIFLQHGIIKDWLTEFCADKVRLDMFVCGAKPEYDYVLANFGHNETVVKYLGLARFDNLHDVKTKNQVLFMPTFRKWLQGKSADDAAASEFIKTWNDAITDKRLINALEKHNLELIFYPHYVIQKYAELFESKSNRVKIAKFKDYDVQTLLIESKLLVTDFSSVFFDFGYMSKPTVYYQFDRERYINEHYDFTRGYFSYDRDGFGEVAFTKEHLVSAVVTAVERGFTLEEKYKKRIKAFFPLNDKHNCDRIFDRIKQLPDW